MPDFTITINTDQPLQVDRVLFEALQRATQSNALESDLELLSQLLIGAMKAENEIFDTATREVREQRENATIERAVKAAIQGSVSEEDAKFLGTIRTDKIQQAIEDFS